MENTLSTSKGFNEVLTLRFSQIMYDGASFMYDPSMYDLSYS